MLLKGKTAVVTGCNRGIGKAILKKFAENGADVFACVRKETDEFQERIKNLSEQSGVEIIPLYFDIRDAEAMKNAVGQIRKSHRKIDILVNNAGMISANLLFHMTPIENMRELFEVNFFAQIRLTQYISRLMQKNPDGGSIIFMSSIAALDGSPGQLEYVGSKAAVLGATKTLAREFGAYNIRVNAIAPGLIETDMGNQVDDKMANEIIDHSPLRRWGKPEEIANVALFLASDLSSYVTGEFIRSSGGGV
ncbi:MAG: SDR family oxidoreductase [Selenomonadaceae bacterium]|nr:SDR family oxidoreductase [Selenomonadaceae bacterium]